MKRNTFSVIVWLLGLALAAPVPAGEIEQWTDAAAGALRKQRYRGDAAADGIVAIRCADQPEDDERLARACSALRYELARSMDERGFDVVDPRRSFDVVSTWEHVACGRDDAVDYLGWSVVEMRIGWTEDKRPRWSWDFAEYDQDVEVTAHDVGTGALLHQARLDLDEIEDIRLPRAVALTPPFTVSRRDPGEQVFASHLADRLVCVLKDLPDKFLLDEVVVRGEVTSPAQREWAETVGQNLAEHLNRVLRSGYVRAGSSVLEISLETVNRDTLRVVPRIVKPDRANGNRVLLDGAQLCGEKNCVVRIVGSFSPLLADPREPARKVAPRAVRRSRPDRDLQATVEAIGDELAISAEAVRQCVRAIERGGQDAAALRFLLRNYDPRSADRSTLPGLWRAWYEFGHPLYEPYFPDSTANFFVEEVEHVLFDRLDQAVFGRPR